MSTSCTSRPPSIERTSSAAPYGARPGEHAQVLALGEDRQRVVVERRGDDHLGEHRGERLGERRGHRRD